MHLSPLLSSCILSQLFEFRNSPCQWLLDYTRTDAHTHASFKGEKNVAAEQLPNN